MHTRGRRQYSLPQCNVCAVRVYVNSFLPPTKIHVAPSTAHASRGIFSSSTGMLCSFLSGRCLLVKGDRHLPGIRRVYRTGIKKNKNYDDADGCNRNTLPSIAGVVTHLVEYAVHQQHIHMIVAITALVASNMKVNWRFEAPRLSRLHCTSTMKMMPEAESCAVLAGDRGRNKRC